MDRLEVIERGTECKRTVGGLGTGRGSSTLGEVVEIGRDWLDNLSPVDNSHFRVSFDLCVLMGLLLERPLMGGPDVACRF